VGYAVSVVNARRYDGTETMSYQVLADCGLIGDSAEKLNGGQKEIECKRIDYIKLSSLFLRIADVFYDQYEGWQKKKMFQKQFLLSDFKKQMGLPAESFKNQLEILQNQIQNNQWDSFLSRKDMFVKLQRFYEHQIKLLQSYEKDAVRLENDTKLLKSWIDILQEIIDIV
jgi:hypothetical protein